ncbi:MAG TPA: M1 family aminopeptidase [Terriglobales bacterium]
MTKVTGFFGRSRPLLILCVALCAGGLLAADSPADPAEQHPAAALYQRLSSVGLDKQRIFHIRGASLDRSSLHFTLDDGTIAFTEDVAGHITGAIFAGEGETLLVPPNQMERGSMVLFTGEAILEEQFETAYFRFNDDTFTELRPFFRPAENADDFFTRWNETAKDLSQTDALRIFMSLSEELPVASGPSANSSANPSVVKDDRYLHAHLQGTKLSGFDIYYDSRGSEQIWAGQLRTVKMQNFYDVWTSFSPKAAVQSSDAVSSTTGESGPSSAIKILSYKIRADVKPPTELSAEADLQLQVLHGGMRTVLFELSRVLRIKDVQLDGRSVEFIHNQSLEGTQLARRGNDVVAVVFPEPVQTGQQLQLRFTYSGEVISQAGPGLLYVGERGNWYPNLGMGMSNFDLEFHYPASWTLLATGKQVAIDPAGKKEEGDPQEQASRWVSLKAIPFAGFNLGKYARGAASAHDIPIEAYATNTVEKTFPRTTQPVFASPAPFFNKRSFDLIPLELKPVPAKNVQYVAESAARAVDFFSTIYGPYPFSSLKITQMPGYASQGWPGMIFLSTYAFLTDEEKAQIQYTPVERTMIDMTVAHETAHQWWGDLVSWNSYRDQWLLEALANYSSALLLKEQNPVEFHAVLDKYRDDLLVRQEDGGPLMDAGPVTLGVRLSSSKFPAGYEAISYGRGTWLFYMLHSMIKDGTQLGGAHHAPADDLFLQTMHRIRDEYADKTISTRDLIKAFEIDLPPSLRYEGRKSLDWFYDSWVSGTSIPRFELSKVKFSELNGKTVVTGSISEKEAADNLITPVPVYALLPRKALIGQVFVDEHEVQFKLTAPAGTRKIVLDPDHTLLTRPE